MAPRLCKYGCQTLLEGWDEENRKFIEAGTGGLHTKERCQEAKAKLNGKVPPMHELAKPPQYQEEKDDHGNEETKTISVSHGTGEKQLEYVDHTLKPELNLKTLTDPTPEGIDLKYNNFAKEHKIRYSQSHVLGSQYTVYVWYEESK